MAELPDKVLTTVIANDAVLLTLLEHIARTDRITAEALSTRLSELARDIPQPIASVGAKLAEMAALLRSPPTPEGMH